jgi:hypothetical protein
MSHGSTVSNFPLHATGLQNPLATSCPVGIRFGNQSEAKDVARKPKIEQQKQAGSDNPAGSAPSAPAPERIVVPKAKAKAASSDSKQKKTTPRKKAAKAASSAQAASPAGPAGPSDEEIRIRAYFIAERRLQLSLAGDSAHDWIEAKRQLIEEAGPASS